MFNQMTATKNEDGVMPFSPGPNNASSTTIKQMIEEEVEKRTTPKESKSLEKRVFQEDDEEDAKSHYQERLEKLMKTDEKVRKAKRKKRNDS